MHSLCKNENIPNVGKAPLPHNKRNCYPPYPDHYLNILVQETGYGNQQKSTMKTTALHVYAGSSLTVHSPLLFVTRM